MAEGDALGLSVPRLYQEFQDCLSQLRADQDYVKTKDQQQHTRRLQQEDRAAADASSKAQDDYWAAHKEYRAADQEYWRAWDKNRSSAGLGQLGLAKQQAWAKLEGASAAQDAANVRRDRASAALGNTGSSYTHDAVEAAVREKETRLRRIAYEAGPALKTAMDMATAVEHRLAAHRAALQGLEAAKMALLQQTMVEVKDASDLLSQIVKDLTGLVWKYDFVGGAICGLAAGLATKAVLGIYNGLRTVLCSGLVKIGISGSGIAMSALGSGTPTPSVHADASAPWTQFLQHPVLAYQVLPGYWDSSEVESQIRRAARDAASEIKPGGLTQIVAKIASKAGRRGSFDVYHVLEMAYYDMFRADIKVVLHAHAMDHERKCIQEGSALLKDLQAALPTYQRQVDEIRATATSLGIRGV